MANKKIRLTYLWADEYIMQRDFQKGVSDQMTEWANKFYADYGFELDVDPPAEVRRSVDRARKYALRKSDGIQPDVRPESEVIGEEDRALAQTDADSDEVMRLWEAAIAQGASVDRFAQRFEALRAQWHAIWKRRERKLALQNGWEDQLRLELTEKLLDVGIGDGKRLTMVFCWFQFQSRMRMRDPERAFTGVTMTFQNPPVVKATSMGSLLQWPYPFTVLDLRGSSRALAHEVVHGAGEDHPLDARILTSVDKAYRGRKVPGRLPRREGADGGRLSPDYDDPSFDIEESKAHYETVMGGFLDGPPNDLMNYSISQPGPKEVKLRDEHKRLLEVSFFAR